MTLPPGLQAVRERAQEVPPPLDYKVSRRHLWDNRNRAVAEYVPALLDLIETLAGALERLRLEFEVVRCDCGEPWAETDGHDIVRAALDKYREFK